MTKNTSRTFATMDEDERRKFALEEAAVTPELPTPLEFDDPRDREVTESASRRKQPEEPE